MTYEEFEWHILRMAYEDGVDRLRPSMLAYALGIPHDRATAYLEQATHQGVLEMELTEDGLLEYSVHGLDRAHPLPRPVWKNTTESNDHSSGGADGTSGRGAANDEDGMDGSVSGAPTRPRGVSRAELPASLKSHIASRYATIDGGSEDAINTADERPSESQNGYLITTRDDAEFLPVRIESNDEAFCDPSRTMFMRQIRVYGSQPQQVVQDQVARLFQSLGYRIVDTTPERMRFERGSVMFILALVPLFVLILPLFVYLFLYTMGRSTIQQEPLELDVSMRRGRKGSEPFWEIDLTFVGLHGVVLGAADQKVLNHEIDTLREELRWALTGS